MAKAPAPLDPSSVEDLTLWVNRPLLVGDAITAEAVGMLIRQNLSLELKRLGFTLARSQAASQMQINLLTRVWDGSHFDAMPSVRSRTEAVLTQNGYPVVEMEIDETSGPEHRSIGGEGLEMHAQRVAAQIASMLMQSRRFAAYVRAERRRADEPEMKPAVHTVRAPEERSQRWRSVTIDGEPEEDELDGESTSTRRGYEEPPLMLSLPGPSSLDEAQPPSAPTPRSPSSPAVRSIDSLEDFEAGDGAMPAAVVEAEDPVIAVFDVEDVTSALKPDEHAQLGQYLRTRIAERLRFRVVPQTRIRARLIEEKGRGYGPCYDERCQIQLGKALAAEKSLAARILRFENTCALVVTRYDLVTETADQAVTIKTSCRSGQLIGAVDDMVEQLRAAG